MLNKLGKLLKYEFRFYFRILPPIYMIIILIAIAARFQGFTANNYLMPEKFLLIMLLGAIIIAMFVITIILVIQRYTDNFMKDAGSLMFSLPVTVWALLASKVIAAFCMILFGFLSIVVSTAIHSIGTENWDLILSFIPNNAKDIILSAAGAFSGLLQQICLFYAVITVSYMLPRFRNLAAFAMYFFVMFFIGQIPFRFIERSAAIAASLINILPSLIFAAIFFCITGFLLKRSYNLE